MSFSSLLFRIITILALIGLSPTASISLPNTTVEDRSGRHPAPAHLLEKSRVPLSFVPNAGQLTTPWQFQTHSMGSRFLFAPHNILLFPGTSIAPFPLHFMGANPGVEMSGGDRLPGVVNYFIGNDPARWQTNLPTYASINYRQLYPGIDLRYEGAEGLLKGTFTVAAGNDPEEIRWCYGGETSVSINEKTGDLLVNQTPRNGSMTFDEGATLLRERAPVAWQEIGGRRIYVPVRYMLLGKQLCSALLKTVVGFDVGDYDPSYPLIIDPTLEYSTYLGGTHDDIGISIAVDNDGNAYITGATQSADFPVMNAWQPGYGGGTCMDFPCSDAFVTKLSSDGRTLLYSTFLGGSDSDYSWDLAIDEQGNVYVTGVTHSVDFPLVNPFQPELGGSDSGDAFIIKLSPDGATLLFSTYLGGKDSESGVGITVGNQGEIYIAGSTQSVDFPTVNPFQSALGGGVDAFITKLSHNGDSLIYSTYLGGHDQDFAYGLSLGEGGDIYITGPTRSDDFPTLVPFQPVPGGGQDVFVTKLSPDGSSLIYSSYLGGNEWDEGHSIAVDIAGNAYIVGSTMSADFPLVQPFQSMLKGYSDAFIIRIKPDGSGLDYSTYLGGTGSDTAWDVIVDDSGYAYITGKTHSADFPTAHVLQEFGEGVCYYSYCGDAFAVKLKSDGQSLLFSTFVGGSHTDDARGIAIDNDGNIYITGRTWSTDFPVINAFQPAWNEGYGCVDNICPDGFVTKIALTPTTLDVDTYVQSPVWVGGKPGGAAMLPIEYGNNGASDALSVTITATLDISLTYLSDTSGITPTVDGNTLVWSLPDLVFLETGDFSIVVELPACADYGTRYGMTIAIASAGPETFLDDNVVDVEVMAARQIFLPLITR